MSVDGDDIRDSPFVVQIAERTALSRAYRHVRCNLTLDGRPPADTDADAALLEQPPTVEARIRSSKPPVERDALSVVCYEASSGRSVGTWELRPQQQPTSESGSEESAAQELVVTSHVQSAGRHVLYVTYEYTNIGHNSANEEGLGSPYRVRQV